MSNQTLDPIRGGIIMSRIILLIGEFRTTVLMNSSISKSNYSKWRNPYEYPKETLDCNAHMHHHNMVFCICHHIDYI